MFHLIKGLIRASPRTRRWITGLLYEQMSRRFGDDRLTMMNFGYGAGDAGGHTLELAPEDEFNRFPIQLYHHVAARAALAGKEVLEVGSGRGGGARFLRSYLGPASVTGVELSASAVEFSRRVHRVPGLLFLQGDAEDLPLEDRSVDVVVNVESSHCYGSVSRFLSEVRRVLRPGGSLVLADVRDTGELEALRRALDEHGPSVPVEEEDITAGVMAALERTVAQKEELLAQVPWPLRGTLRDQSGAPGGVVHRAFREGRRRYLRVWRREPPASPRAPG